MPRTVTLAVCLSPRLGELFVGTKERWSACAKLSPVGCPHPCVKACTTRTETVRENVWLAKARRLLIVGPTHTYRHPSQKARGGSTSHYREATAGQARGDKGASRSPSSKAHERARTHTHTHTHTHAPTLARVQTHTRARAHTHARTHAHARTREAERLHQEKELTASIQRERIRRQLKDLDEGKLARLKDEHGLV